MKSHRARSHPLVAPVLLAFLGACTVSPQVPSPNPAPGLTGTSWQLVRFEGGDGTTLTPDTKGKYTIAFGTNGQVSVRIDCNRGNGTWESAGANHLEFGPLALTRAMCPPGSLHDRVVGHWPFVRSYVIKDGHLFLSLMADGGIYEFEPTSREATVSRSLESRDAFSGLVRSLRPLGT
jgi:heat shock protein HslJ